MDFYNLTCRPLPKENLFAIQDLWKRNPGVGGLTGNLGIKEKEVGEVDSAETLDFGFQLPLKTFSSLNFRLFSLLTHKYP